MVGKALVASPFVEGLAGDVTKLSIMAFVDLGI
jgi:hypothetical protein